MGELHTNSFKVATVALRRGRGDALHTARLGVRQQHGDGRIEGVGSGQLLAQRAAPLGLGLGLGLR